MESCSGWTSSEASDVPLFDKDDIEEALRTLVEELVAAGAEAKIKIVGAAAITVQVGREAATSDIDALHGSSPEVKAAVERIAEARNWSPTWLNDAVKMYMSHRTTDADWELGIDEGVVTILYARPQLLLAMKLRAGRGLRDAEDIDGLLNACEIASRTEAEELFDHYYPEEIIAERAMRQLQARFPEAD
jgi:hypothetical protein